jgi:hypothetical protein
MRPICLLFILLFKVPAFAAIWPVGASQTYTVPSQVVNLVQDGDTIEIDGGIYLNDASKWTKKNLKIIGLGTFTNRTILRFDINIPNGKGIFVFESPGNSDNPHIENIVFEGAQISDNDGANGAGIRFQAKDITVKDCVFRSCQNGILEGHGSVSNSNVTILNCEFDNNGYQLPNDPTHSGYEHHIYISASADTLLVQNCYFHDPRGQANSLKTRAQRNYILYNYIDEGDNGYGSYELNIAQGGLCVIMGNVIVQGTSGANHSIVGYDAATNALQDFYFVNNTVINKYDGNVRYFNISPSSGINTFQVYNNIFASVSTASVSFFGTNTPSVLDTVANIISTNIPTLNFVDYSIGDYHLTVNSPAVNQATNPGTTNTGYSLLPTSEYVAFTNNLYPRIIQGTLDIGAYEYNSNLGLANTKKTKDLFIYPNPSNGVFYLKANSEINFLTVTDNLGNLIYSSNHPSCEKIDLSNYLAGVYHVSINMDKQIINYKILKY